MIEPRTIEKAVDLIVAHYRPEQVFVVGSYSMGTARDASDLDLLVIKHTDVPKRQRDYALSLILAPLVIPIDVNVFTPQEMAEEQEDEFGFARTATERQGKLVYSRDLGDFRALSLRWDVEPSAERHVRLQRAGGEWQLYQAGYERMLRQLPDAPWEFAASHLRRHFEWRVADFGCGEGALARAIPNRCISLDHVATRDDVISCDLANVPLPDVSVDAVVLSLALIGTNWRDYLAEANRVVRPAGRVFVTELITTGRSRRDLVATSEALHLAALEVRPHGPFLDVELRRDG